MPVPQRTYLIGRLLSILLYLSRVDLAQAHPRRNVARFEVTSVDSRSVVVRIAGAGNATRFDMNVFIYDLDRLKEYRRSELSTVRYEDQLFSFDGLTAGTWFAIRIQYRLIYRTNDGFEDFATKQELIVRTKDDTDRNRSDPPLQQKGLLIRPSADELVQLEGIVSDSLHINVTLLLIFPLRSQVSTVIVPELKCELGTVKPPAQQLHSNLVHVHFDLRRLLERQRQPDRAPNCYRLCIYPFLKALIDGKTETFRAKEWCGSLEEAYELIGTGPSPSTASMKAAHWWMVLCAYVISRLVRV